MTNPLPPDALTCPACGASVKYGARACVCGLPIAPPPANTPHVGENLVVQAESLYINYLTSRLEQAVKAMTRAKMNLRADRWNAILMRRLRESEQLVANLRAQLAAQEIRMQNALSEADEAATASATSTEQPAMSPQPTVSFRENQMLRANQIGVENESGGEHNPPPFITREELDDLRRNTPPLPVVRRQE
jgi:hypothetical protein